MTACAKAQNSIGKVVSIWRYLMKSMMKEGLNSSYVTQRGLIGDRNPTQPYSSEQWHFPEKKKQ
jgi:hypothetical protein